MVLFTFAKSYEYWIVFHTINKFIVSKYDSKIIAQETCNILNNINLEKDLVKTLIKLKSDKYYLIKYSQNYIVIDAILPYILEFKINNKKIGYKHYNDLPYYVIYKNQKKYYKNFKLAWNSIYEN
jgi:hypothetical protein